MEFFVTNRSKWYEGTVLQEASPKGKKRMYEIKWDEDNAVTTFDASKVVIYMNNYYDKHGKEDKDRDLSGGATQSLDQNLDQKQLSVSNKYAASDGDDEDS